jgi:pyrroloquinoline-quinone synthase
MDPEDRSVAASETLRRLDALIQSRSILRHPFYVAWQDGALTRQQLQAYASVYYPHVAAFPSYLHAAIATARDPVIRAELERNLRDELTVPQPHAELWLDFAAALDLDRAAVAAAAPQPAAQRVVASFQRLSRQGTPQALAALYAYESQQPDVSRRKADGLQRHYGIQDDAAVRYFDVHAVTDLEHRAGEQRALERCVADGAAPAAVLAAAGAALDAYWALLDGVCLAGGM